MVKYDLVTETLLADQLHVLYGYLPLLFAFQLQLLSFNSNKKSYSWSYFIS